VPDPQQDRAKRRVDQAVGNRLGGVLEEADHSGGQQVQVFALGRALADGEADVAGEGLQQDDLGVGGDLGQIDVVGRPRPDGSEGQVLGVDLQIVAAAGIADAPADGVEVNRVGDDVRRVVPEAAVAGVDDGAVLGRQGDVGGGRHRVHF